MYIETKNLILRKLTSKDVTKKYVDWLNDDEVNKYLEIRHDHQTLESCRKFVEICNKDTGIHLFGIFLKISNQHIGNVKIGFINEIYKRGEISIFIGAKEHWGKGLGTEAVKAASNFSKEILGLKKIEAGCYEDNLGSLRIFLKSGFVVEGFKRNHVMRNDKSLGTFLLGLLTYECK